MIDPPPQLAVLPPVGEEGRATRRKKMKEKTKATMKIRKLTNWKGTTWGCSLLWSMMRMIKKADAVWEATNKRMDSRRKDRREVRLKLEIER